MAGPWVVIQSASESSVGFNVRPSSVISYSTRGGISGWKVRFTKSCFRTAADGNVITIANEASEMEAQRQLAAELAKIWPSVDVVFVNAGDMTHRRLQDWDKKNTTRCLPPISRDRFSSFRHCCRCSRRRHQSSFAVRFSRISVCRNPAPMPPAKLAFCLWRALCLGSSRAVASGSMV